MNVMYLCDNSYAMMAGISIYSLLDNNLDADEINIFLIADNISEENCEKLQAVVNSYKRKIIFIAKPDIKSFLGRKVETHWWTDNVFSRIFLGEVLKDFQFVHKLIYIDCDTLVIGSIKDLWQLELHGNIGAGVCEAMGNLHKKAIGLSKKDNYFNAGMFLIDIDRWRLSNKDHVAKEFVKSTKGKLEYADESVFNGIISKELVRLSPKYNLTSLSIYFTVDELKMYRKSYISYSKDERQEALDDPRIIHFTSTYLDVRPWVEGCRHPYAGRWLRYKETSLWADEPCMKDNRSAKKRLAKKMVFLLPKYLRLQITGIIHAYIKPLKYVLQRNIYI